MYYHYDSCNNESIEAKLRFEMLVNFIQNHRNSSSVSGVGCVLYVLHTQKYREHANLALSQQWFPVLSYCGERIETLVLSLSKSLAERIIPKYSD